jgi:hypothetical protein
MGGKINAYRLLMGKAEGKRLLGRRSREWTILEWIIERQCVMLWIGLISLRIGTGGVITPSSPWIID